MNFLKKILLLAGQLILLIFLAFIAREAWLGYRQEKQNAVFLLEGRPVDIQVDRILHDKRDWKDWIGYAKYIAFRYQGRNYDLRYLPDSGWVGAGSRLDLLYSPSLDAFLQPSRLRHPSPFGKVSKLVDWSVVGTISYAHRWLFAVLALGTLVALMGFSILHTLTGIAVFRGVSRLAGVVAGLGLLFYFNWNIFSNYRYLGSVRSGVETTAKIDATEKQLVLRETGNQSFRLYYYAFRVPDSASPNGLRRIMISENEFNRYHAGDRLPVYYHAPLDEMVSTGYGFESYKWIFLGLIWIIAIYLFSSGRKEKNS